MSVELKVFKDTDTSLPLVSYLQISTVAATGLLVCPDLKEFIPNKTGGRVQWYKVRFKTRPPLKHVLRLLEHIRETCLKKIHPCRHTYTSILRTVILIKMVVISVAYWSLCGLGKVRVDRLWNDSRVNSRERAFDCHLPTNKQGKRKYPTLFISKKIHIHVKGVSFNAQGRSKFSYNVPLVFLNCKGCVDSEVIRHHYVEPRPQIIA